MNLFLLSLYLGSSPRAQSWSYLRSPPGSCARSSELPSALLERSQKSLWETKCVLCECVSVLWRQARGFSPTLSKWEGVLHSGDGRTFREILGCLPGGQMAPLLPSPSLLNDRNARAVWGTRVECRNAVLRTPYNCPQGCAHSWSCFLPGEF